MSAEGLHVWGKSSMELTSAFSGKLDLGDGLNGFLEL